MSDEVREVLRGMLEVFYMAENDRNALLAAGELCGFLECLLITELKPERKEE